MLRTTCDLERVAREIQIKPRANKLYDTFQNEALSSHSSVLFQHPPTCVFTSSFFYPFCRNVLLCLVKILEFLFPVSDFPHIFDAIGRSHRFTRLFTQFSNKRYYVILVFLNLFEVREHFFDYMKTLNTKINEQSEEQIKTSRVKINIF